VTWFGGYVVAMMPPTIYGNFDVPDEIPQSVEL
jgi:hypothetical protein